jgi:hypothetical protein
MFPFARVFETIEGTHELKAHGTRDMPIWGREYRSSKYYDYYLHDPEMDRSYFARSRILALTEYIYRRPSPGAASPAAPGSSSTNRGPSMSSAPRVASRYCNEATPEQIRFRRFRHSGLRRQERPGRYEIAARGPLLQE